MAKATKTYIQKNPPAKLLKLLREDCDGGFGEFDPFLPKPLVKISEETDASYIAQLHKDGKSVLWEKIH